VVSPLPGVIKASAIAGMPAIVQALGVSIIAVGRVIMVPPAPVPIGVAAIITFDEALIVTLLVSLVVGRKQTGR
jgi:hypothetical protein